MKNSSKKSNNNLTRIIISLAAIAVFIYASYSYFYEFQRGSGSVNTLLNTLLASAAVGTVAALYSGIKKKKTPPIKRIIAFIAGTCIYALVQIGVSSIFNAKSASALHTVSITLCICFAVFAVLLLLFYIRSAKRGLALVNIVLALAVLAAGYAAGGKLMKGKSDDIKISLSSTADIEFQSIDAQGTATTRRENMNVREWFDENVINTDFEKNAPVYNFKIGSELFSETLDEWTASVSKESRTGKYHTGGKTTFVTLKNEDGITVTVEATIYEEATTCEWTLFIKNNGETDSEVISDFYAADMSYDTGDTDLYYSRGSTSRNDDFTLLKTSIPSSFVNFYPNEGRSSDKYLPYFNFCGKRTSFVLGIGWTGEWNMAVKKEGNNTFFKVGQKEFEAYLKPGEEVRSPLVSLTFYYNINNPLKGFNAFRNWLLADNYPKNTHNIQSYVIADEFSKATTDELIEKVKSISSKDIKKLNTCWMDAGWYSYTEDWYDGNGTWTPDPVRFPDGLKPLANAIRARGAKFLLWYEPERLREGTALYEIGSQHEGWISEYDGNIIWNLADDDACDYLADYITKSLKDNGVSVYRQDFNFEPLTYWHQLDESAYDGRTGICENKYVTNLYKYLDALRKNVSGLVIDNCASGGRRLDLEMMRRSVPLWRSDYNCDRPDDIVEATQSMSYGISFWLPISGTVFYPDTEYSARSSIYPCYSFDINSPFVGDYNKQRALLYENYYPLAYGGVDTEKILAMQFGNDEKGEALIYKRADVEESSFIFKPCGLSSDVMYELYDIDDADSKYEALGRDLMQNGMEFELPEGEKALIIMYGVR